MAFQRGAVVELIDRTGLKQYAIVDMLNEATGSNLNEPTFSNILKGKKRLSDVHVFPLSEILGVPVDVIRDVFGLGGE